MSAAIGTMAADDVLAEQAAHWIVLLGDDDADERDRAREAFEAWKKADPRHAAAALDMERVVGRMESLRNGNAGGRPARAALDAVFTRQRRNGHLRRAGAALAIAFLVAMPGWLALQLWPPSWLAADMRTVAGEWEAHVLPDGSRITLNSGSAINLRFDDTRRVVELVQGGILVDVASDAGRPFVVKTTHGSIQALGTRFTVDRGDEATLLNMIESRVLVRTADGYKSEEAIVHAGQRMRITAEGLGPMETIDPLAVTDAWEHRQLVVNDYSLAEVLDELGRQRPGGIHYNPEDIRHIRVSAVLPLDDTDRALQLLLANFPELRIRRITRWWVLVDAPEERQH